MGYYSDTTKRLLNQIGRPYEYTSSQGPDLSSLIMALMFMPKSGKTVLGQTPLPKGRDVSGLLGSAPGGMPGIGMDTPEIFKWILNNPDFLAGIPALFG